MPPAKDSRDRQELRLALPQSYRGERGMTLSSACKMCETLSTGASKAQEEYDAALRQQVPGIAEMEAQMRKLQEDLRRAHAEDGDVRRKAEALHTARAKSDDFMYELDTTFHRMSRDLAQNLTVSAEKRAEENSKLEKAYRQVLSHHRELRDLEAVLKDSNRQAQRRLQ